MHNSRVNCATCHIIASAPDLPFLALLVMLLLEIANNAPSLPGDCDRDTAGRGGFWLWLWRASLLLVPQAALGAP